MEFKWEWFVGGRDMFLVAIIMMVILVIGFVVTYIYDLTTGIRMNVQEVNPESIQMLSESYVNSLGININKNIKYRFVRYKNEAKDPEPDDMITLGTFHEWNDTYYIDISIDLYKSLTLDNTVEHETRHMIVEYLKDENIIDLTKYTEEIAQERNSYYNNLFNSGVYLLKERDKEND